MGPSLDGYPYGTFRWAPDEPWPEPLTALAAVAGATSRIRLGTGILIAPLRPAVLLAKTAATLDVLSGGRLELGVGVGWQRAEYEALGLDFDRRWSLLDDAMRACRVLWDEGPSSFVSESVSFEGIHCSPKPAQDRLPVWLGARATLATAARVAGYGDAWFPLEATTPEQVASGAAVVREALAGVGRDPDALHVRVPLQLAWNVDGSLDERAVGDAALAMGEAGATLVWTVVNPFLALSTIAEVGAFVEALAGAIAA
jgi:probable F420-dependent oxidoreductase